MLIDRAYAPVETLGPGTRIAVWTVGCSKRCEGCANPELWCIDQAKDIDDGQLSEALIGMARQAGIQRITFTGGDPFEQPESLAHVLAAIRPHFKDILVYTGYTLDNLRAFADGSKRELQGMPHAAAPCGTPIHAPYDSEPLRTPCAHEPSRTSSDRERLSALYERESCCTPCEHESCDEPGANGRQQSDRIEDARVRAAVKEALDCVDALIDGPYVESLNDGACPLRGSSNQIVHVFSESLQGDYDVTLKQPRRIQNVHFGDTFMSIGIHGRPTTTQPA